VLLFLACHGGPDPRRPSGPLYLFTHDTDPKDVAGTALAMDEIDRSLRQLVQAERVVIIVDSCHSAGVGGRRAAATAEATNQYLDAMARAKGGVALLTSAEAAEASEEDERWGGGHGVFTHFLLEGMRGAADGYRGPKDGIVSVGELFEYVRDRVQEATEGRQHPAVGTTAFDRGLPMAVTGDLDVEQRLSLARRLVDVGWLLDDPAPFLLAARQFLLAADLKRHLPVAEAERGAALLAASRADEAARALEKVTTTSPDEVPPDAWLYLGLARAATGSGADPSAAEALREYCRRVPDGLETAWASAYATWLERTGNLRRRALLVGVETYDPESEIPSLAGPANDIELIRRTLIDALGLHPDDISVLEGEAATRSAVLEALGQLAAGEDDAVLVYFAGHATRLTSADEPYLLTYEGIVNGRVAGITSRELVEALDFPARGVVLVVDAQASPALMELAGRREGLTLLLGSDVHESSTEIQFDGRTHGVFSYVLARVLAERPDHVTYGELIDTVRARARDVSPATVAFQTPQLVGSRQARLFRGRFPAADLWRVLRRRAPVEVDLGILRRRIVDSDAPPVRWALGRALIASGDAPGARIELARARGGYETPPPLLLIDVARASLAAGDTVAAESELRAIAADELQERSGHVARALAALTAPAQPHPALVVVAPDPLGATLGIEQAAREVVAPFAGAAGLAQDAVVVVSGASATSQAVLKAFDDVAKRSEHQLAVLLILGVVSFGQGSTELLTSDGPVAVVTLAEEIGGAENVVTVASVLPCLAGGAAFPGVSVPLDMQTMTLPNLGSLTVTIFEADHLTTFPPQMPLKGEALSKLLDDLPAATAEEWTFARWIARSSPDRCRVAGPWAEASVQDRSRLSAAKRHLVAASLVEATDAVRLAEAAIAQRRAQHEEHPEGYLQLGVALDACGRWAAAISAMRTARDLYEDESVAEAERRRDSAMPEWRRQARYHYGRLEYLRGDNLNAAVGSLHAALADDPDDARVLFHLGQAIRTLVERETLVDSRRYLRRYLDLGAPLGGTQEILRFLSPTPATNG
ncbi:MAG: caspase family protein, partial [Acidimicrobiales bacterium]